MSANKKNVPSFHFCYPELWGKEHSRSPKQVFRCQRSGQQTGSVEKAIFIENFRTTMLHTMYRIISFATSRQNIRRERKESQSIWNITVWVNGLFQVNISYQLARKSLAKTACQLRISRCYFLFSFDNRSPRNPSFLFRSFCLHKYL